MNNLHSSFTRTLLRVGILVCMLPVTAQAQLLGGVIKANKVITIPTTITLASNVNYFVASVYDENYLPYSTPTAPGAIGALDVGTGDVLVDVQGAIPSTGVTISIPVTTTAAGTLPAYTHTVNIPASMTSDGISRDLTLSWSSVSYTAGSITAITATITAVGGPLNAIKLDINNGIGNDFLGVLLGQLPYPCNNAGTTATVSVRDIPGIPDRMFGQVDNAGLYEHNFLYLPVQAEDGKIWLNNNLGADYANINSGSFNIAQQATAYNDWHAYGSLFQWGRKPDGHELVGWTSASAGTLTGATATRADIPAHANFITSSTSPYNWRVTTTTTDLWDGATSANNPCPSGFRVPTDAEYTTLVSAAGITNYTNAQSSVLHFSVPGYRNGNNGTLGSAGASGYYWSSMPNGTNAYDRYFYSGSTTSLTNNRALGFSVRCLQN
jgi:uncharacterized protein (TIGR02145 family)